MKRKINVSAAAAAKRSKKDDTNGVLANKNTNSNNNARKIFKNFALVILKASAKNVAEIGKNKKGELFALL